MTQTCEAAERVQKISHRPGPADLCVIFYPRSPPLPRQGRAGQGTVWNNAVTLGQIFRHRSLEWKTAVVAGVLAPGQKRITF